MTMLTPRKSEQSYFPDPHNKNIHDTFSPKLETRMMHLAMEKIRKQEPRQSQARCHPHKREKTAFTKTMLEKHEKGVKEQDELVI